MLVPCVYADAAVGVGGVHVVGFVVDVVEAESNAIVTLVVVVSVVSVLASHCCNCQANIVGPPGAYVHRCFCDVCV